MTLPLFPHSTTTPVHQSAQPSTSGTIERSAFTTAPRPITSLSIREITALIHERMRPLTLAGPRIIHAQWIRPGINSGSRGFLSVTLADTQDSTISIDGFIWDRKDVGAVLKQGQVFGCDLLNRETRSEVMIEATVDYWVKKSKPYLRIHGLNHVGMKGLRQQQREAALHRLEQDGLLERNKTVPWAKPGLRIYCIAKQDSDGCRDAMAILSQSGFRFQVTIHNVAVQGINAVPTILEAFRQVTHRQTEFDAVLLIRGGGNELDLVAFDDYTVARAVATCPLPVVTGLGHTADHSVCDVVSAMALETPTAAARFLVDRVINMAEQLRLTRERIRNAALQILHRQEQYLLSNRPRFIRDALSLVHRHQAERTRRWHGILTGIQAMLHRRRTQLHQCHQPISAHARRTIETHRTFITQQRRTAVLRAPMLVIAKRSRLSLWRQSIQLTAMMTLVGPARLRLKDLRQQVHHVGCDAVRRIHQRLHTLHVQIQALSPERYFALGLSYVTRSDGQIVRTHKAVAAGDAIHIHLQDGTIAATVNERTPHDNR